MTKYTSYLLMIITAFMWSFVGVMVKTASLGVSSSVITLCRFLFGVVFLYLLMVLMNKKITLYWNNKWIWIGVFGKCLNYVLENIAISKGNAYGNVVIWPIQTIFIAIVAIIFFNEEMYFRKGLALALCLAGVIFVSFKGQSVSEFYKVGFIPMVLFILSAIGAGAHIISIKKLVGKVDSANMNLTMFLLCTMLTTIPIPFTTNFSGHVSLWAVVSLIGLGFITGLSFYFNAEVLKKIPFLTATLIGNSSILFTLLWARLIFNESINIYIMSGAILLVAGIILFNIPVNISIKNLRSARFNNEN